MKAERYQLWPNRTEARMNNSLIQLLVLAGIAIFLVIKLRSVLGTRQGFEKPPVPLEELRPRARRDFEVIEGGPDRDITDHMAEGTTSAKALAAMKTVEPEFSVNTFLQGARGAYEMILMAFEKGELDRIRPFLSDDVEATFAAAISARDAEGLTVEAKFVGMRELALHEATFDTTTKLAEIAVRYVGETTSVVRNKAGEIVEGSATEIKRQRDVWTFARTMGAADPNWQLVATGD
jgi:Tim44-like domain